MNDVTPINFEGIKMAMAQTRDGHTLTLRVHPSDLSMELLQLPVGQRIMVVVVPIDDDDGDFRNKQRLAEDARNSKLEQAAQRRYKTLLENLIDSPYIFAWAESKEIQDPDKEDILQYIQTHTDAKTWADKAKKLEGIADEVRRSAHQG